MNKPPKEMLRSLIPLALLNYAKKQLEYRKFKEWENNGYQSPTPRLAKIKVIEEYRLKFYCTILIETGTYRGDMVDAFKTKFNKVVSIELSPELHRKAKLRFRNDKNVLILNGDSGKMLPFVLKDIHEPVIFWLDAHYFGGISAKGDKVCPIFEELDAIFFNKNLNHYILIDDASWFTGNADYPSIEQLTRYIKNKNAGYQVEVIQGIIRCFPHKVVPRSSGLNAEDTAVS